MANPTGLDLKGQVPLNNRQNSETESHDGSIRTYLIIGSGRLAKHLAFYFSVLSDSSKQPFKVLQWDRHQDPLALNRHLQKCTHVLLAIKDSALTDFFHQHLAGFNLVCVHFSAATVIPEILSAHPLMTFSTELYSEATYRQIHFVIQSNSFGYSKLQQIIPDMPNASTELPSSMASYYHAMCVMAGNMPQILWQKVNSEFKKLKLPEDALNNYLRQTLANFIASPQSALTGPIARNDSKTIEANLNSLKQDQFQEVYQAFVNVKRGSANEN